MWTWQGFLPIVLLSVVNRDSTGGSGQTGPRFCLPENAYPRRRTSGVSRSVLRFRINGNFFVERKRLSRAPVPGVSRPVFGFLTAYVSCEGEVREPRHERARFRLANPVGGVRPGQWARRLWVHRAMILRKIILSERVVTVLFVSDIPSTY